MTRITIGVYELLGTSLAVTQDDGQRVYEAILMGLRANRSTTLSFRLVSFVSLSFLQVAIGQLLSQFSRDELRCYVNISHLDKEEIALCKKVVDNAEIYFQNN